MHLIGVYRRTDKRRARKQEPCNQFHVCEQIPEFNFLEFDPMENPLNYLLIESGVKLIIFSLRASIWDFILRTS